MPYIILTAAAVMSMASPCSAESLSPLFRCVRSSDTVIHVQAYRFQTTKVSSSRKALWHATTGTILSFSRGTVFIKVCCIYNCSHSVPSGKSESCEPFFDTCLYPIDYFPVIYVQLNANSCMIILTLTFVTKLVLYSILYN